MKKSLYLLSVLFIVGFSFLWGCSDEEVKEEPETEIETKPDVVSEIVSELNFTTGSNNQTITFTTNKEWVAAVSSPQGDASWCSISPSSGAAGTVNITVSTTDNTGYDDRSATITIKTGNSVKTLTVTQRQKNAIIISKDNYEIPEEGGTIVIEANTNVELDVSIPSEIDWIHHETSGTRSLTLKKVILQIDKNNYPEERRGIIIFRDNKGSTEKKITIKQKQKNTIILSEDTFEISEEGGTIDVDVNTNVELEVSIPAEVTWLRMQTAGMRALSAKKVTFIVDKNETPNVRTATITLKDKNSILSSVITISQQGKKTVARTVHVDTPGTLQNLLGSDFKNIEELTITGRIYGEEISFLHYYIPNLQYLDISNVFILSSGSTVANEISKFMFDGFKHLHTIILPNTILSIGDSGFSGCKGLTTINIPNSVSSIGNNAFYGCTGLTSITIPNSVTSIGRGAFWDCTGLTSVNIPNSVNSIGDCAFSGCTGLTSINIPNSVNSIGDNIFRDCKQLKNIFTSSDNTHYSNIEGVLTSKNKNELISFPAGRSQHYTIPNSITSIGNNAFYGCTGLTSITIPNSVTSIGRGAFWDCTGLTTIDIPNGVNSIEQETFYGCKGLISIDIPNSVTSIGYGAFKSCRGLTSVNIPNSVNSIGDYAFSGCSGLTSINIPPNSINSIGQGTFSYCTGLISINTPNSVTSIGGWAFLDCTGLTSININSATFIEQRAFENCSALTFITLPYNINKINNEAFKNCNNIKEIHIKAINPPVLWKGEFSPYRSTVKLYVPKGTKELYQVAWSGFYQYFEE